MNKLEYDDLTTEQQDICGTGEPQPVRKFAHELRKAIWKKIFGITGKERAVTELQSAIDQPANPKSWQAIQRVAQRNTQLYEAAFKFIPRNEPIDPILPALKGKRPEGASIWPVWNYNIDAEVEEGKEKQLGIQQGFMPFQTEFWVKSHPQAAQAHQEAAKAHQQAAAVHEKAAEAHQQAVQAHSQILLKATLMVGAQAAIEKGAT